MKRLQWLMGLIIVLMLAPSAIGGFPCCHRRERCCCCYYLVVRAPEEPDDEEEPEEESEEEEENALGDQEAPEFSGFDVIDDNISHITTTLDAILNRPRYADVKTRVEERLGQSEGELGAGTL